MICTSLSFAKKLAIFYHSFQYSPSQSINYRATSLEPQGLCLPLSCLSFCEAPLSLEVVLYGKTHHSEHVRKGRINWLIHAFAQHTFDQHLQGQL